MVLLSFLLQLTYMTHLKHALEESGQCLLEMPTGTGKTVSLYAFSPLLVLPSAFTRSFSGCLSSLRISCCIPNVENSFTAQEQFRRWTKQSQNSSESLPFVTAALLLRMPLLLRLSLPGTPSSFFFLVSFIFSRFLV